ncbi:MAG: hypothetical protein V7L26_08040 [Nostoc sp.]|uniref:hypothetical protein n=1 Tax=Nostoc sp. TaxID=1180 RepID=UPI002FEEC75C
MVTVTLTAVATAIATTLWTKAQEKIGENLGDATWMLGGKLIGLLCRYIDDENSLLKLALNRGWLNCVGIEFN